MKNLAKHIISIVLSAICALGITIVSNIITKQSNFFILGNYGRIISFNSISVDCCLAVVTFIVAIFIVNLNTLFTTIVAVILDIYLFLFSIYGMFLSSVNMDYNFDFFPGTIIPVLCLAQICVLQVYLEKIKKNENKLKKLSNTDQLTGIGNRRSLYERLDELTSNKTPFHVAFFDLDNFKLVNDVLGHSKGDELIKRVAILWSSVNGTEIYRLGGDEFAVIIVNKQNEDAERIISECLDYIQNDKFILSLNSCITASAGVAHYPFDSTSIEELLTFADTSMYKAKESGKNNYIIFSPSIFSDIVDKKAIEDEVRNAIKNRRLFMLYQPQFNMDHRLVGFEALIRMFDSKNNIISPDKFIPVCENSTLILDIDKYVLSKVCEDIKNSSLLARTKVSINISGKHFINNDFAREIVAEVERSKINKLNVEIELTETSLVESFELTQKSIEILNSAGIQVALDDFGTGYSSLSYLYKLPFNTIKIDKKFIDSLSNQNQRNIVKSIISIAHAFKINVISEGIETEQQLEILKKLGNDFIQGFIWGKPTRIDSIDSMYSSYY